MLLCYHGTDLDRFSEVSRIKNPQSATHDPPIILYLGSMGSGYDLQTIIEVAARWKQQGRFPAQIHFAGSGPQEAALRAQCKKLGLLAEFEQQSPPPPPRRAVVQHAPGEGGSPAHRAVVRRSLDVGGSPARPAVASCVGGSSSLHPSFARVAFHGYLQRDAATQLIEKAAIGLVPNRPDTRVACPYKAAEYAAAGCALVTCLRGELPELLRESGAGTNYTEGDPASLDQAISHLLEDPDRCHETQKNARRMAERLFDRKRSYAEWIGFLEN